MKWFNNPASLEELKAQYKRLALANHPDRGGRTEDMQEINAEFEMLFPVYRAKHNAESAQPTTETAESSRDEFYTQNGWKGDKYDISRSTKDIAALVRAYVKSAYPECKFSVTYRSYAGGSSISVSLMSGPQEALRTGTEHQLNQYYLDRDQVMTPWAKAIMMDVNDVIKSYLFSDCDGMIDYFDTNFYYDLSVGRWDKPYATVDAPAKASRKQQPKPEKASATSPALRVEFNEEFSGIEVYFPAKPDEATREALKGDGWRWHRQKGCWYNKNTEQHLQTLRSITENPQQLTA